MHHVFKSGTQHIVTHNPDVLVAAFPGNQDVVMLADLMMLGSKHRPLSHLATFTPSQATEMEEAVARGIGNYGEKVEADINQPVLCKHMARLLNPPYLQQFNCCPHPRGLIAH